MSLNAPLPSFLILALLIACSFGCAPPASQSSGEQGGSASTALPEITDETIRERINYVRVRDIPEENGKAKPIIWNFYSSEPKEITVVDKQMDGPRATIVLDIKTQSTPRAENQRQLAGQIRTEWELRTGWVLRKWEIVSAENISMKYRDLPKPAEQNSNH